MWNSLCCVSILFLIEKRNRSSLVGILWKRAKRFSVVKFNSQSRSITSTRQWICCYQNLHNTKSNKSIQSLYWFTFHQKRKIKQQNRFFRQLYLWKKNFSLVIFLFLVLQLAPVYTMIFVSCVLNVVVRWNQYKDFSLLSSLFTSLFFFPGWACVKSAY